VALITGAQLRLVQRLFGLAPASVVGATDLDTQNVSQVLPLGPEILRRSDNILGLQSGGWFEGVCENVHSGADNEVCSLTPYTPGAAAGPGFPDPVPPGWDIWLLGASVIRFSGAGGASAALVLNGNPRGLGIDDSGAAVAATPVPILAVWDSIIDAPSTLGGFMVTEAGDPWVKMNLRLPRGIIIEFHSTSDAAVSLRTAMIMGIFPEGMGQDVVA